MIETVTPEEFLKLAKAKGISIERMTNILTLAKSFTANEVDQYSIAESDCFELIRKVPASSKGSTWGTTSDGVGGYVGLRNGRMTLNISGINKPWLTKLMKLVDADYATTI